MSQGLPEATQCAVCLIFLVATASDAHNNIFTVRRDDLGEIPEKPDNLKSKPRCARDARDKFSPHGMRTTVTMPLSKRATQPAEADEEAPERYKKNTVSCYIMWCNAKLR